jgi:copper chaperone NosL
MIVNESKCSCAVLIQDGRDRDYKLFDDIGCMIDFEQEHKPVVISRFVHDHASGTWVDAQAASFLVAAPGKLATPMGSGIIGFADRAGAETKQRDTGGTIVTFDGLAGAYAAANKAGTP